MNKRLFVIVCLTLLFQQNLYAWGRKGHMVIAEIAERHLTKDALIKARTLLGKNHLAQVANWADEIKSYKAYDYAKPWHYVNVEDGVTYKKSKKNSKGDLYKAIEKFKKDLASKKLSNASREEALKFLVHFVGDLHQPLHTGRKSDKGGNKIEVTWFKKTTNLHNVWDEKLVEYWNLSYSELVKFLDQESPKAIKKIQKGTVLDWTEENILLRSKVYDYPETKLSYSYTAHFKALMEQRLLEAGLRLAKIINEALN